MDFAAIDFETANHRSDSACQLAVVVVEQGHIVEERCWLIRPKDMYFSDRCIAVHGILPRDCADQPEWHELWPDIQRSMDGRVLIAHNASFDLRVLMATMQAYDLYCPAMEYSCTRLIARRAWPGRDGYGLMPTATALGLTFRHHDALEDARVCARIALAAAEAHQATSLSALEETLSITRGKVEYGVLSNPKCIRRSRKRSSDGGPRSEARAYSRDGMPVRNDKKNLHAKWYWQAVAEQCSQNGVPPLADRCVVLHGSLLGLSRDDAIVFLTDLGAQVHEELTPQTNYLILGEGCESSGPWSVAESGQEPELSAAMRAKRAGGAIQVLTQRQLFKLIPGAPAAATAIAMGRSEAP